MIQRLFLPFFFFSLLFGATVVGNAHLALAANLRQQISGQVSAGAESAGFGAAKDPRQIIGEVVQIVLGVTGTVFIVLIVMASYWYITAKGDETKVEKATKTLRGAIIGLIVVLMAYGITRFVSFKTQESLYQSQRSGPP